MRLIYLKPQLNDLTQGSRIAFAYKMKLDAIKHQGKKSHFYTRCAEVNISRIDC